MTELDFFDMSVAALINTRIQIILQVTSTRVRFLEIKSNNPAQNVLLYLYDAMFVYN